MASILLSPQICKLENFFMTTFFYFIGTLFLKLTLVTFLRSLMILRKRLQPGQMLLYISKMDHMPKTVQKH